jgi:hypothetical protein
MSGPDKDPLVEAQEWAQRDGGERARICAALRDELEGIDRELAAKGQRRVQVVEALTALGEAFGPTPMALPIIPLPVTSLESMWPRGEVQEGSVPDIYAAAIAAAGGGKTAAKRHKRHKRRKRRGSIAELVELIVRKVPGLDSGTIVRAVLELMPDAKPMSIYPTIYRLRGDRIEVRDGGYHPKVAPHLPQTGEAGSNPTEGGAPPE